jgi:DNA-binding GntR family transcriptional regulator
VAQPLTASTASAIAAALLRDLVINGELRAGQVLREQELATRFNMSRTPVREALAQLASDGLLVKDAKGTTTVFAPAASELIEIYTIRLRLEPLAVRMSAERIEAAAATAVAGRANQLETANGKPAWAAAHEHFHLQLIADCGMNRLTTLVRNLRLQSEPYARILVNADREFAAAAAADHRELATLVAAGAAAEAEAATTAHLGRTVTRIRDLIDTGALN